MNKIVLTSFTAAALVSSVVVFAGSESLSSRTAKLERQVNLLKNKIDLVHNITPVELYAHGPAIVSSPSFSLVRPGAHELLVNLSKVNRDLQILKLRQKMDSYAINYGFSTPTGPVIVLSGGVEGQFIYNGNYNYSKNSRADIDLTRAELDITGEIAPWATATMIINYDNSAGYSSPVSSNTNVTRDANSRLQIDRAFLTAGQLERCPFYFTLGQAYAPFGIYDSFMVTTANTRVLGRTKDRMMILGYSKDFGNDHKVNAQVYGLAGSTQAVTASAAASSEFLKHGGFDINYRYGNLDTGFRIGGGILGNLAESDGLQQYVFANNLRPMGETIYSKVMGYNLNFGIAYKNFDILGEYVAGSRAFDQRDIQFNGTGPTMSAANLEGAYSFKLFNKTNTVFAGWGNSEQALVLGLPKNSLFAGYTVEWVKNTLASIEYRHDINYDWTDATNCGPDTAIVGVNGRHANTVTVQLGAYF